MLNKTIVTLTLPIPLCWTVHPNREIRDGQRTSIPPSQAISPGVCPTTNDEAIRERHYLRRLVNSLVENHGAKVRHSESPRRGRRKPCRRALHGEIGAVNLQLCTASTLMTRPREHTARHIGTRSAGHACLPLSPGRVPLKYCSLGPSWEVARSRPLASAPSHSRAESLPHPGERHAARSKDVPDAARRQHVSGRQCEAGSSG